MICLPATKTMRKSTIRLGQLFLYLRYLVSWVSRQNRKKLHFPAFRLFYWTLTVTTSGGVAQLGERHVRNVEAAGSTPAISTTSIPMSHFRSWSHGNRLDGYCFQLNLFILFLKFPQAFHTAEVVFLTAIYHGLGLPFRAVCPTYRILDQFVCYWRRFPMGRISLGIVWTIGLLTRKELLQIVVDCKNN